MHQLYVKAVVNILAATVVEGQFIVPHFVLLALLEDSQSFGELIGALAVAIDRGGVAVEL